jgi:predicted phage tail protein
VEQKPKLSAKRGYLCMAAIIAVLIGLSFLIVWMLNLSTWWSITAAGWLAMLFAVGVFILQGVAEQVLKIIKRDAK